MGRRRGVPGRAGWPGGGRGPLRRRGACAGAGAGRHPGHVLPAAGRLECDGGGGLVGAVCGVGASWRQHGDRVGLAGLAVVAAALAVVLTVPTRPVPRPASSRRRPRQAAESSPVSPFPLTPLEEAGMNNTTPRPEGAVTLRPRRPRALLGAALDLYQRHLLALIGVAAVLVVPGGILNWQQSCSNGACRITVLDGEVVSTSFWGDHRLGAGGSDRPAGGVRGGRGRDHPGGRRPAGR